MARPTALVVCPGRGSYGRAELGSLARGGADTSAFDAIRAAAGKPTLTDLDGAARFSPSVHLAGENAAPLIYAASMADLAAFDRNSIDIVAVTGNSLGWYTTLATAGAVGAIDGFRIVDAMGAHSGRHGGGGQLIASVVDGEWRALPGVRDAVLALAIETGCALSIDLGGTLVLAGGDAALKDFAANSPVETVRLAGNGPFHTPLMHACSAAALATLPAGWFGNPDLPMIDGRGHIWRRWASAREALWRYTFEAQILERYDFALAIAVAMKEFAPDRVIVLGPGDGLGAAIAQVLIGIGWLGLSSKDDFAAMQADDPFVLAMGRTDQRRRVTR